MAEINHLIRIDAGVEKTFAALSDNASIASWFTETQCENWCVGAEVVWFGEAKMTTSEFEANKRLVLHVQSGGGWDGTDIAFSAESLAPRRTIVRFDHSGWAGVDDHFRDCSLSWAYFLQSLQLFLETGTGTPEVDSPAREAT